MKKTFLAVALCLGMAAPALSASAQTIDQRHQMQQHRIHQGERDGTLARGEASKLERQQLRIGRAEREMRYRHHGHLTRRDRMMLRRREMKASRSIYNKRHNRNYRHRW